MVERNWDDTDIEDNDVIPTSQWIAHVNDQKGHSGRHEESGSDSITAENLATSGASGTVPTSQGDGTLAMDAIEEYWVEDSNSPFMANNAGSLTATLADRYDVWKVHILTENAVVDASGTYGFGFNDAGSNAYTVYEADGTVKTDEPDIESAVQYDADGVGINTTVKIQGEWNSVATASIEQSSVSSGSDAPVISANISTSSPLQSITVNIALESDITVRAFGRNIR